VTSSKQWLQAVQLKACLKSHLTCDLSWTLKTAPPLSRHALATRSTSFVVRTMLNSRSVIGPVAVRVVTMEGECAATEVEAEAPVQAGTAAAANVVAVVVEAGGGNRGGGEGGDSEPIRFPSVVLTK
jgi:hypothetical protein